MVQAILELSKNEDRKVNIIKAKYGLKNKSQAINLIIDRFEDKSDIDQKLVDGIIESLEDIKAGRIRRVH